MVPPSFGVVMRHFRLLPAFIAPIAVIAAGMVLIGSFYGRELLGWPASAWLIFTALVFLPAVLNSVVGVIAQQRGLSRLWLVPFVALPSGSAHGHGWKPIQPRRGDRYVEHSSGVRMVYRWCRVVDLRATSISSEREQFLNSLPTGLSCMAAVAQRLPVGFSPEQLLVSVVRNDVIGQRGWP